MPNGLTQHPPDVVAVHRAAELLLADHVADTARVPRRRDRKQLDVVSGEPAPLAEQRGESGCPREPMATSGCDCAGEPKTS
jgi:hypothetical protein